MRKRSPRRPAVGCLLREAQLLASLPVTPSPRALRLVKPPPFPLGSAVTPLPYSATAKPRLQLHFIGRAPLFLPPIGQRGRQSRRGAGGGQRGARCGVPSAAAGPRPASPRARRRRRGRACGRQHEGGRGLRGVPQGLAALQVPGLGARGWGRPARGCRGPVRGRAGAGARHCPPQGSGGGERCCRGKAQGKAPGTS